MRTQTTDFTDMWNETIDDQIPQLTYGEVASARMGLIEYAPADISTVGDRHFLYCLCTFNYNSRFSFTTHILDSAHLKWLSELVDGSPRWLRVLSEHFFPHRVAQLTNLGSQMDAVMDIFLNSPIALGQWLHELSPQLHYYLVSPGESDCPRYLIALLKIRPDLQKHFAPLTPKNAKALMAWWAEYGKSEYPAIDAIAHPQKPREMKRIQLKTSSRMIPDFLEGIYNSRENLKKVFPKEEDLLQKLFDWWNVDGKREHPDEHKHYGSYQFDGINIIGFPRGEFGVAEDVRMAAFSAQAAELPFAVYAPPYKTLHSEKNHSIDQWIQDRPIYHTNLIFLPAIETLRYLNQTTDRMLINRYNICAWQWELPHWPADYVHLLSIADELWPSSNYTANALKEYSTVPVVQMPMAVTLPAFEKRNRFHFGLQKDPYTFLFVYDGLSFGWRKNPIAVIQAFQQAFPNSTEVALVIKSMNVAAGAPFLREIKDAVAKDSRIQFLNQTYTRSDIIALFDCCDAYVSLHRAEGFGRTIAEAMLLSKPVVVSEFSGNMEFCNEDNCFLVQGKTIPVGPGEYLHHEGQYWFDADIGEAARMMRLCVDDPQQSKQKAEAGRKFILTQHSAATVGARYADRLKQIGQLR